MRGNSKTAHINVRMTEEERAVIMARSSSLTWPHRRSCAKLPSASGRSPSRSPTRATLRQILHQMKKQGGDLNQAVHAANAYGVDAQTARQLTGGRPTGVEHGLATFKPHLQESRTIMKTKMLTALLSSLFLAILACPVLAAPHRHARRRVRTLDASAIPTTFDAETVLGWWLSDGVRHPSLGALFVFLLALCTCALIACSSAPQITSRGRRRARRRPRQDGSEVVKGSMTWDGSTNPSSRGFVYGFTKYHGKPCYLYDCPRRWPSCQGPPGQVQESLLSTSPQSTCSATATPPTAPSPRPSSSQT